MWEFLPLTAECNLNYCLRVSISFLLLNELLQPKRLILKFNFQKKLRSWHPVPSLHGWGNRWENNGNSDRLYFLGLQNHCRWWLQPWLKTPAPWKKSYGKPRQCIKKQRHYFSDKGPSSQSCGFSSCHIWLWELDHKESWALKNWCFLTVVLEKTLESPLDCKEIKPVNPKGN